MVGITGGGTVPVPYVFTGNAGAVRRIFLQTDYVKKQSSVIMNISNFRLWSTVSHVPVSYRIITDKHHRKLDDRLTKS